MNTYLSSTLFLFYFATAPVCCMVCTDQTTECLCMHEKIGQEVFDILAGPEKTTQFKTVALGSEGFSITGQEENVPEEALKSLQKLLLNEHSYDWKNTKNCVFMPEMGFRFKKMGKEVIVLFSFSGDQLKLIYNSKSLLLDYDPIKNNINNLIK